MKKKDLSLSEMHQNTKHLQRLTNLFNQIYSHIQNDYIHSFNLRMEMNKHTTGTLKELKGDCKKVFIY